METRQDDSRENKPEYLWVVTSDLARNEPPWKSKHDYLQAVTSRLARNKPPWNRNIANKGDTRD